MNTRLKAPPPPYVNKQDASFDLQKKTIFSLSKESKFRGCFPLT